MTTHDTYMSDALAAIIQANIQLWGTRPDYGPITYPGPVDWRRFAAAAHDAADAAMEEKSRRRADRVRNGGTDNA